MKFTIGQKVYYEFGYDWYRGSVVSVEPLIVKRAHPFSLSPKFIRRHPEDVIAR